MKIAFQDIRSMLQRDCALTQGYVLDCREGIGGIKEVYIIEFLGVDTVTEVSGIVTAITKETGKRFYKYSLVRETSNTSEAITGNEQNGTIFYTQTVNLILNKRNTSVRNEILILARINVMIVVVENTGKAWLFGQDQGLLLSTGTSDSGTAWGDRNGYTLPFVGNERALAPEVEASVLLTLETPG